MNEAQSVAPQSTVTSSRMLALVGVGLLSGIVISVGVGYWSDWAPLFPKTEAGRKLEVPEIGQQKPVDVDGDSGRTFVEKTFLGQGPQSPVRYRLVTPSYEVTLEHPEYWQAYEVPEQTLITFNSRTEEPNLGRPAVSDIDDYIDVSPLTIHAIKADYCQYEWCMLKTQSTYQSPSGAWDYLGPSQYCDAGYCGKYNHIYKQMHGNRVLYVVTYDPVHEVPPPDFGLPGRTKTAFDSIQFAEI